MIVPDQYTKVKAISEKDFNHTITLTARAFGWLVYHTYNSRRSEPGFPDLVLVKGNRILFREVKRKSAE